MDTNKLNIECMFKCDVVMVFKCITQRLSHIWFSIHKKVKQHWRRVEKKTFLKEKKYGRKANATLFSFCDFYLFELSIMYGCSTIIYVQQLTFTYLTFTYMTFHDPHKNPPGILWGSWNTLGMYLWAMKYFSKFLMGHEIFLYVLFS